MSMRSQIQKKSVSSSYSPPAQKATSWQRPFSDPVHDAKPDGTVQSKIAPSAGFNLLQMKLFPDTPTPVQTKLTVGAPGDKYEQEADSMANKVMTMPAPENEEPIQREALPEEKKEEEVQTKPLAATVTPLVQRETAPEEPQEEQVQAKAVSGSTIQRETAPEEPQEEQVQAKAESEGKSSNNGNLESQLNGSKGGGSPLPDEVRAFMEPRFGADFSGVRVHTDGAAAQMNKELGAQAFAHGSDIYYGGGKSPGKNELTAHELTHVVQQSGAGDLQTKMVQASFSDWWEKIAQLISNVKGRVNFETVADGNLKEGEAPNQVNLPPELTEGMHKGWNKSFPGGTSQEQGGILVKQKDKTYAWKAGKPGDSGSFSPNYEDLAKGETLIGVGHTHPYDKSEGGYTDVSFSGQDLARLVYVEDRIAVVQSGEGQFLAARTAEFDKMLKGLDEAGKNKLFNAMKKTYDDAFSGAKGKFPEKVEVAVKAVCSKYHLVYYKGKDSQLTKQSNLPK